MKQSPADLPQAAIQELVLDRAAESFVEDPAVPLGAESPRGLQLQHREADSFGIVTSAFDRAVLTRPDLLCESHYRFGDQAVRMRVVGRALAQHLASAFAHLQTSALDAQAPQLVIDLWDENETGIPYPAIASETQSDMTWGTGGGFLAAYAGGRLLHYRQPQSATWFDRSAKHIVGWRACGERLPILERSKPLPILLSIWFYDRDVHIIHAGLVARNGEGVLVGGPGGSGKTTASLMCLFHGFDYLGDDHVGLSQDGRDMPHTSADDSFVGYSLYNGARVSPHLLTQLPQLKPHAIPSDSSTDDKFLVQLSQIIPARLAHAATIRAIVLPRICHLEKSLVRRATKRDAMLQLAPTSFFTPFSSGARGFERLGQLVDRVPLYWLEMSEHLDEIPPPLNQILTETLSL